MDHGYFQKAIQSIWTLVRQTNKYIDETAPWALAKDSSKQDALAAVMAHLAASLRLIALLAGPMMPHLPAKMFKQLGLTAQALDLKDPKLSDLPAHTHVIKKGVPLFPRLDKKTEVAYLQSKMTKSDKQKGRKAQAAAAKKEEAKHADAFKDQGTKLNLSRKLIKFDKWQKVEIKVAEIKDVKKTPKADKLLTFQLDAGDPENRQVLSGIAKWYPEPEKLVGKKVLVVSNLEPRKMRGEISQGMLLSIQHHDGRIQLVTVPSNLENGSILQ